MPQAIMQGKSTPKLVRVNADDGNAALFRNLGNGHKLPFIWGTSVTMASGTAQVVVSSGVSYNAHKVSEAVVMITPTVIESTADLKVVSDDIRIEFMKIPPIDHTTLQGEE